MAQSARPTQEVRQMQVALLERSQEAMKEGRSIDNKTLTLFRNSLKQVETEIARLTDRASGYREAIATEEARRDAKAKKKQKPPQAPGPG